MCGTDKLPGELFPYIDPEQRAQKDHPLRPIQEMANPLLAVLP